MEAFDLADRLQTPVIVLLDLDLGMNDWSTKEFEWNDNNQYDRGKVLSKEDLDGIEKFGRYLDVDGDGIPYRTYPGTHPEKGAFLQEVLLMMNTRAIPKMGLKMLKCYQDL